MRAHNQHSETRRPSDHDRIVTTGPKPFLARHGLLAGYALTAGNWRGRNRRGARNFTSSGLRDPHMASKKPSRSITHSQIPYAPEQGIDWAVVGNLVRSSRKSFV